MGVIKYLTEKINELLDKVDRFPETVEDGKTPVFVTGTTTTLDPGLSATAEVVQDGVDENGNPKYKINFGVPKGLDGASEGGGGAADSVQWAKVLNKPSWVNSATKPSYTASEVGALPVGTFIPSKLSELTNDSKFLTSADFKTINGESIVGSGNISLSGTGGIAEAPKDGETYGRNNGLWVKTSQMEEAPTDDKVYARKNKGWTTVLEKTETALLDNYLKQDSYTAIEPTDSINSAIGKLESSFDYIHSNVRYIYELKSSILNLDYLSTSEDIITAIGGSAELQNIKKAFDEGRLFYIKSNFHIIPVSIYNILGSVLYLSFSNPNPSGIKDYEINILSPNSSIKIKEKFGYLLNSTFYNINKNSTSMDIDSAIGGENGIKKIIKAIEFGNNLYINGLNSKLGLNLRIDISVVFYLEQENGDIMLALSGIGSLLWGTTKGGILSITYTKATNEFSASVESI